MTTASEASRQAAPESMTYSSVGVDTADAQAGLQRLITRIKSTWPDSGIGHVKLDVGFFANVLDLGPVWLAITTDGVGTKALVAQMAGRYDTIGIDCVAMNVNDVVCVGAKPISLVDYLAVQEAAPDLIEQISIGLVEGARVAGVSITGGEIAQVPEMLAHAGSGFGFDLAATAVGILEPGRLVVGDDMEEGDVVFGVSSNGVHSNGLTLARKALLGTEAFGPDQYVPELGRSVVEELLRPTHIYVPEFNALAAGGIDAKALIHVTSDGFLNLTRVTSDVGYVLDSLPEAPPVFHLIQDAGPVDLEEMYLVYNMGIGFCVVVAEEDAEDCARALAGCGRDVHRIGYVIDDAERRVRIPMLGLTGHGGRFTRD